jgi:hypothetical protein
LSKFGNFLPIGLHFWRKFYPKTIQFSLRRSPRIRNSTHQKRNRCYTPPGKGRLISSSVCTGGGISSSRPNIWWASPRVNQPAPPTSTPIWMDGALMSAPCSPLPVPVLTKAVTIGWHFLSPLLNPCCTFFFSWELFSFFGGPQPLSPRPQAPTTPSIPTYLPRILPQLPGPVMSHLTSHDVTHVWTFFHFFKQIFFKVFLVKKCLSTNFFFGLSHVTSLQTWSELMTCLVIITNLSYKFRQNNYMSNRQIIVHVHV